MKIIPAIDLRHGRVVQLVGGDPEQVAIQAEHGPAEQAKQWQAAGATKLHVVDLDAALGGQSQLPAVDAIRRVGLPIQFGGGIRSMVAIQRLLELDTEHVIIGTQGVKNPDWLMEVTKLWPGRIILAVDAFARNVAVQGWTEKTGLDVVELARSLDHIGLGGFLYTNVEKEGRMEGIDETVVADLCRATEQTPLLVSGGISSMADLETLNGLGVDGVVLGMSIYSGKIDLQTAIKQFEPENADE